MKEKFIISTLFGAISNLSLDFSLSKQKRKMDF
jgi:hypothetical protein